MKLGSSTLTIFAVVLFACAATELRAGEARTRTVTKYEVRCNYYWGGKAMSFGPYDTEAEAKRMEADLRDDRRVAGLGTPPGPLYLNVKTFPITVEETVYPPERKPPTANDRTKENRSPRPGSDAEGTSGTKPEEAKKRKPKSADDGIVTEIQPSADRSTSDQRDAVRDARGQRYLDPTPGESYVVRDKYGNVVGVFNTPEAAEILRKVYDGTVEPRPPASSSTSKARRKYPENKESLGKLFGTRTNATRGDHKKDPLQGLRGKWQSIYNNRQTFVFESDGTVRLTSPTNYTRIRWERTGNRIGIVAINFGGPGEDWEGSGTLEDGKITLTMKGPYRSDPIFQGYRRAEWRWVRVAP